MANLDPILEHELRRRWQNIVYLNNEIMAILPMIEEPLLELLQLRITEFDKLFTQTLEKLEGD